MFDNFYTNRFYLKKGKEEKNQRNTTCESAAPDKVNCPSERTLSAAGCTVFLEPQNNALTLKMQTELLWVNCTDGDFPYNYKD